jgi:hypothetical protein
MGQKSDKLRRLVDKLAQRYGSEDADVQRLQSELDVLDAFEFRYPNRFEKKSPGHTFRTPAKQLFYAAPVDSIH